MEGLYRSPIFLGIERNEIDAMLDGKCRLRDYSAGELVAMQGDVYKSLLIVDQGVLRTEMTDAEGIKVIIEDIASPRAVAPAFLFATNNRLPVNIYTISPSVIASIPKNAFIQMMREEGRILENTLRSISDRNHFLSERYRMLRFGTIKSKLKAYFLEQMQGKGNGTCTIPHTQQELADMFGVTRPALSRAIRQLEDSGIIIRKGMRRYEMLQ